MQAAVECRLHRPAVLPQSDGVALVGLDLLVGVGDAAGDEAGQGERVVPGRRRGAQQGVEPEIGADLAGPGRVLPVEEPESYRVGLAGRCGPQQFDPLGAEPPVAVGARLVEEDEAQEQKGDDEQEENRKQRQSDDLQCFLHDRGETDVQR